MNTFSGGIQWMAVNHLMLMFCDEKAEEQRIKRSEWREHNTHTHTHADSVTSASWTQCFIQANKSYSNFEITPEVRTNMLQSNRQTQTYVHSHVEQQIYQGDPWALVWNRAVKFKWTPTHRKLKHKPHKPELNNLLYSASLFRLLKLTQRHTDTVAHTERVKVLAWRTDLATHQFVMQA